MSELVWVMVAGFAASLVDGALGMGFGPTSSTILLSAGLSPTTAATSVNVAKVFTGVASAVAHARYGNVDRDLVIRLAGPGAVGAVVGATVLVSVDGDRLRVVLAVLLLAIGLRILWRFRRPLAAATDADPARSGAAGRATAVVGLAGGATNAMVGAWGPVVTPYLVHRGESPRRAIGSVNTAEVAVAVVAVGSLFGRARAEGISVGIVVALLVGGTIAAPLSAHVIRFVAPRVLGLGVAGLLLLTQCRALAADGHLPVAAGWCYLAAVLAVIGAGLTPWITATSTRRDRRPGHAPRREGARPTGRRS